MTSAGAPSVVLLIKGPDPVAVPAKTSPRTSPRHGWWRAALWAAVLLWAAGCDTGPSPSSLEQQRPAVSSFAFAPDSVVVANLPPDRVENGRVQVPLSAQVRAADPDGQVERVVFTIEPSSSPQNTIVLSLPQAAGDVYGSAFGIGLPVFDEIYSVRAYAIDNDSLISNQVRGQFRVVAPDTATGSARGLRLRQP